MPTTDDIDLRRYPPTIDDLMAGFAIASRDIAPALKLAQNEHGMTALISAFVMLADILTAFGLRKRRRFGSPARPRACSWSRCTRLGEARLEHLPGGGFTLDEIAQQTLRRLGVIEPPL